MTLKHATCLLLGITFSSAIWLLIDRLWLWDSVISVVWVVVSLAAGPVALFAYGLDRWSTHFPARPHGHQVTPHATPPSRPAPPPAPIVINMPPEPAPPVRAQTSPPPAIPQRPVQPGDFAEPQGSIFDSQRSVYTDLFGAYRAPNQPNPWDTETPLPPLEPFDDSDKTSPWDDLPVTFDGPLHTGPLLPRRPPAPAEIDLIRSVYAEEGTLNATIRRVYGAKDAKTHGWTKGALEL